MKTIEMIKEEMIKRYEVSGNSLVFNCKIDEYAFNNHYVVNDKQAYIDFINENYSDETVANEITSIEKNGYIVIECKEDRELAEEILMDGVIEPRFSRICEDTIKKCYYNDLELIKYMISEGYFGDVNNIIVEHGYDSQDISFSINNFNYDKNVVDAILEGKITI